MNDLAKEYLRDRYNDGTLDVTGSYLSLRGFVQIFAGEMEALTAIHNAEFMLEHEDDSDAKFEELLNFAQPTAESKRHFDNFLEQATPE